MNATFDSIIPGLASGKYDLGMSSFTDTKEREQTVDFVTYFTAGRRSTSRRRAARRSPALADLCGKKVAVEKGTTQAADADGAEQEVHGGRQAGRDAVGLPGPERREPGALSGRADVGMADSPVADYQVKQSNGQFKLIGKPYGTAPYGIAIPKDNGHGQAGPRGAQGADGRRPVQGDPEEVGRRSTGAITHPQINGATS